MDPKTHFYWNAALTLFPKAWILQVCFVSLFLTLSFIVFIVQSICSTPNIFAICMCTLVYLFNYRPNCQPASISPFEAKWGGMRRQPATTLFPRSLSHVWYSPMSTHWCRVYLCRLSMTWTNVLTFSLFLPPDKTKCIAKNVYNCMISNARGLPCIFF